MTERPPSRVPKKDRTGAIISLVAHVGVIVVVLFLLARTEMGRQMMDKLIGTTRDNRKTEDRPKPPPAQPRRQGPPKAASDAPPPSSGPRRASDAPPAAGEGFFSEERTKGKPVAAAGSGGSTNAAAVVPTAAPKLPALRPFSSGGGKSDIKNLLADRARQAASVEAIGSEQISKTGGSDAGAIVKNVSGATIVDGKYAVVRGLSDRYVTTTFNGAEIPSADPYRRAASLDLFPAQVIDRVVVAKTFTPDQQGAFTGGGINIVSKSFPDRPFANLSIGGSVNSQATGNDHFLTYEGGDTDWLGMDDGTRALPSPLDDFSVVPPQPVYTTGPRTNPEYQARIAAAEKLDRLTKTLGTAQFAPTTEAPPANHNLTVAAGDTAQLFGRPLGAFGSLNYKHDYAFYEDGVSRRYKPTSGGEFAVSKNSRDVLSVDTVNWSAMAVLAYQYLDDHELSFNFLHNQNGTDYVRQQEGTQDSDPTATIYQNRLQYSDRTLDTYQLRGVDVFPALADAKVEWLAVRSETSQDEPDIRFFNYKVDGGQAATSASGLPDPADPTRYFRLLEEENKNFKIDLTLPFRQWSAEEGQFKLGLFDSSSTRSFSERQFYYKDVLGGFDGNPNNYLRPDNLGHATPRTNNLNGRIAYDWLRYLQTYDSTYDAESQIRAAYAMADLPVLPHTRFVGGLRLESTEMTVDSVSDIASGVTGLRVNSSRIEQTDLLPALGLIYALSSNMNVRLHFSETVARPSFREMAGYRSYDPILDVLLDGNPSLGMSSARNYDLRWEWFPQPGELFSVSFYYKQIDGAIERIATDNLADSITFINRDSSTVLGVEFEARKNLGFIDAALRHWSFGGNVSFIQSETSLTDVEYANKQLYVKDASRTRPLYDQSPYILNLDLNYDNVRSGTSGTLVLNAAGPRIAIASPIAEDIYEQPPLTLDFVLGQKLGRHMGIKFTARNLLDPEVRRTYGKGSDLLFSSSRRGRTYGLSVSYDF